MDCLKIVKAYLDENGFDGLQNGGECGCDMPDLIPCGNDFSHCKPGYRVVPPEDLDCEFDYYVCGSKDDTPWE